jgi:error-prone DNA polymerase
MSGGFVITRSRLDEVVPIGQRSDDERTFVEWDKDDLGTRSASSWSTVLGLGMSDLHRKAFEFGDKIYW